jgi:Fe-S-cluster containining protein
MTETSKRLTIVKNDSNEPWYKEGLPFKCTECGACCSGAPGYIWVSEDEIAAMAEHKKMTIQAFSMRYLRRVDNRFALVELKRGPQTYDCVFLKDKKCQVYEARPLQCRTFPWWPENLSSPAAWERTATECEGINLKAPVTPLDEIQKNLLADSNSNP